MGILSASLLPLFQTSVRYFHSTRSSDQDLSAAAPGNRSLKSAASPERQYDASKYGQTSSRRPPAGRGGRRWRNHRRMMAEAAVAAIDLDVIGLGPILVQADLPGADAVSAAEDGGRRHGLPPRPAYRAHPGLRPCSRLFVVLLVMALPFQELEPPTNPRRFTFRSRTHFRPASPWSALLWHFLPADEAAPQRMHFSLPRLFAVVFVAGGWLSVLLRNRAKAAALHAMASSRSR